MTAAMSAASMAPGAAAVSDRVERLTGESPQASVMTAFAAAAAAYVQGAQGPAGARYRRHGITAFMARFGSLAGWDAAPVAERVGARSEFVSFAAFAAIHTGFALDPTYVVASGCRWGKYQAAANQQVADEFFSQATTLGFAAREIRSMWSHLARISTIAGTPPQDLRAEQYISARTILYDTVIAVRGTRPKSLSTPLFGLDSVMFHRGQAPPPDLRRQWTNRPVAEVDWADIVVHAPVLAATMRRYLDQMALSLRPSSVDCFEATLRQLAGMLVRDFPAVTTVAGIEREHIEAYKTWLSARPGYRKTGSDGRPSRLSKTTLGMRLGHLRAFFSRIIEWGYDDVPTRIPVYSTDKPILDKPLPKFLDDAQAAAFMNAARALPDPPRAADGADTGPHRHAAWGAAWADRRRRRPDRHRLLAADPGRESCTRTGTSRYTPS